MITVKPKWKSDYNGTQDDRDVKLFLKSQRKQVRFIFYIFHELSSTSQFKLRKGMSILTLYKKYNVLYFKCSFNSLKNYTLLTCLFPLGPNIN